jgi:hypothetical protein
LSSAHKKGYTAKKGYAARKEIRGRKKGAKKGGHTQKRRGYIRRAKLDFEFLFILI